MLDAGCLYRVFNGLAAKVLHAAVEVLAEAGHSRAYDGYVTHGILRGRCGGQWTALRIAAAAPARPL
jgi:hypothetical protein